ncbi:MAG TPA: hypothetical protein VIE43_00340 [Thermoanaerobaculia bacterium]|nr:hypothetical protein [Thermoanaerobaculia bacterium]
MRMHAVLYFLAGGAFLLAAASPAAADGRVTFNDMVVQKCPQSGACAWKLSCGVEGKPETEMFAGTKAKTKYTVNVGHGLDIHSFPADIRCSAWLDTGWIGTTWEKLDTATVSVPSGGEFSLDINSRAQGSVTVRMSIDSLEIGTPPPAPAAAPKKGKADKAEAPLQFLGVFSPEPEGRAVVVGLEWPAFKKRVDDLGSRGLQLVNLETFEQGGKTYWGGIFRSTQQATVLLANQDWDTFLKNWKTITGSKKRLVNFTVYQNGGKTNFAGLYRDLGEKYSLWVGQSRKDFVAKVKELAGTQGLQVTDMNAYRAGGTSILYAGTFHFEETPNELWTSLEQKDFDAKWQAARHKNMQPLDVETYKEGDKRFYDAIVHGGTPGEVVMNLDAAAFTARWHELVAKGLRPTDLEVYRD